MAGIVPLDAADLQRRLDGSPAPLLVEFVKPGCAHCQWMAPELEALADQWDERAAFAFLDLAAAPDLAAAYGIRGTPTLILFSDAGEELGRKHGFRRRQQMDAFLRHHLGEA